MHRRLFVASAIVCATAVGCYDGDTLVQRVRDRAIRTRLEEIDLGAFRVTLPRNLGNSEVMEVDVHLFGEMPRYKIPDAEKQLEERAYLLHDRTLATLRDLDPADLTQPDLPQLREKMLVTVNGVLDDPAIKSIGIRDLKFMRH